jgi:hypothetical protein
LLSASATASDSWTESASAKEIDSGFVSETEFDSGFASAFVTDSDFESDLQSVRGLGFEFAKLSASCSVFGFGLESHSGWATVSGSVIAYESGSETASVSAKGSAFE